MRRWAILAFAVAAVLAAIVPAPTAVRLGVVLPFLLLGPGLALVPLCRLRDPFAELVVAIALSLAIDVVVSEAMVLAGGWSAPPTMLALAGICIAGVGLDLLTGAGEPQAIRRRRLDVL